MERVDLRSERVEVNVFHRRQSEMRCSAKRTTLWFLRWRSAADVGQDRADVKCLQGKLREPDLAGLKPWWLGVIRLTALEEWRRRRFAWSRSVFAIGDACVEATVERIELDEEASRLQALVARLPARQKEVLHLVFYQGLTLAEAAQVMRVGIGSARRHYERGKARLRDWLKKEERK